MKKVLSWGYVLWFISALFIGFSAGPLTADKITHVALLIVFGACLFVFPRYRPVNSKRFFILSGVFLAAIGEGTYMITKPVLPNLLVTLDTPLVTALKYYGIDLLFTLPIYALIFSVIWWLITTFRYTKWEYAFFFALGQALGDGGAFFLANPFMLILIPYIMLNYHAMNLGPYLSIYAHIETLPRRTTAWKYPIAVIGLVVTYFIGGTIIQLVARGIGLVSGV